MAQGTPKTVEEAAQQIAEAIESMQEGQVIMIDATEIPRTTSAEDNE